MNTVIFTDHALDRINTRHGNNYSSSDLKLLANLAWQNRNKRISSAAFRLVKKINLHSKTRNSICAEAGGYLFIFARSAKPILITTYIL